MLAAVHAAREGANAGASRRRRDLEAQRLRGLAGRQGTELATVETKRNGGLLVEDHQPPALVGLGSVGAREVRGETRHRLAPSHEALCTELDQPAILARGRELSTEPVRGLEHGDLVPRSAQAVGGREAREPTAHDRDVLHGLRL